MSLSADLGRSPGRARRDAGFTLLEVIVALGLMMTVTAALLPQLIVGIKSTGTARLVTQAKGVAQGELERMRNLPYHIAPAAGPYVDVLDRYYRNISAPATAPNCAASGKYLEPTIGWAGYVSATAPRCAYEPSGAFYRSVKVTTSSADFGRFVVVTDTQFLTGQTPPAPVSPVSGYDTQLVGKDTPPASQIGATLTVLYADRGTLRPVSTHTQISERRPATVRVSSEAHAAAVEVGSVTSDTLPLSLSGGLVNLTAALSQASTVTANLAATSAGLSTGEQSSGASTTAVAPPTVSSESSSTGAGALSLGGCSYACWGPTQLGPVSVTAENGLPRAGSSLAPLQSMVTGTDNGGISFGNTTGGGYRPELNLTPPLVQVDTNDPAAPSGLSGCTVGTGGPSAYITASGYLTTTAVDDPASSTVESCAVARTTPLSLFPTEFAPRGVVRITLDRATARCTVQGPAHSASAAYDYQAVVEYWDGAEYVTAATVSPGASADPLDSLPMTTSIGEGKTLGDYIASWSSLTDAKIARTQAGGVAKVAVPGVVTIATQPVRADATSPDGLDPTSVVSLTVGAVNCSALDAR